MWESFARAGLYGYIVRTREVPVPTPALHRANISLEPQIDPIASMRLQTLCLDSAINDIDILLDARLTLSHRSIQNTNLYSNVLVGPDDNKRRTLRFRASFYGGVIFQLLVAFNMNNGDIFTECRRGYRSFHSTSLTSDFRCGRGRVGKTSRLTPSEKSA